MSLIAKLFKVPKGKSLIYWLLEIESGPIKQTLAFVGFAVLFYFPFGLEGAIALLSGMWLHELGHLYVFLANGIKAFVRFLFPLGAVAVPINEEENKRSDLLPWWNIATLLQAGPTVNVLLMIFGAIMVYFGLWPTLGKQLISMNGVLAIFNLLPIWNMDGGQLFHVIFSSLKEKYDVFLAIFGVVVCVAMLGLLLTSPLSQGLYSFLWVLYTKGTLIIFLFLFIVGILNKQGKDNPLHSSSIQAMTLKQVSMQLVWYLALATIALLVLNLPL